MDEACQDALECGPGPRSKLTTRGQETQGSSGGQGVLCVELLGNREMTSPSGVPQDCYLKSDRCPPSGPRLKRGTTEELAPFQKYHSSMHVCSECSVCGELC